MINITRKLYHPNINAILQSGSPEDYKYLKADNIGVFSKFDWKGVLDYTKNKLS